MLENMIDKDKLYSSFPFSLNKGTFKNTPFIAALRPTCDNPRCACQDLEVTIRPEDDSKSDDYLFLFYINIEKKKISPDFIKEITPHSMAFAKAFIKEIEPESWGALQEFLFASKSYIHDHTNLEELKVDFDTYQIKNHAMIPWHEIFPFEQQIIKNSNNSRYLLDDHYCLRSDCNCTHVALSIIKIENNKTVQKRSGCYFNYNKNLIERLDGPVSDDLKKIIKKYGGELRKEYKRRHAILRKLYAEYKKRSGIKDDTPVSMQKIPGRNDPCHCGSGKKYKKCCMV
jgi:hypothetical protein